MISSADSTRPLALTWPSIASPSSTSRMYLASCAWRAAAPGRCTASGVRLWLMTQANGAMPGPLQVLLELGRLVDRRRLGQRDDQHARVAPGRAAAAAVARTASGMPLACRVTSRW